MGKETIKMRIVDWHIKDTEQDFYNNGFIKLLQNKYDIEYSDKPDFLIYGPYGRNHLKYDCVRIFYTEENIRPDYNITDYSMDFDYMDFYDRHLKIICCWYKKIFYKKTNFCSFIVSNGGNKFTYFRDVFFEELSKYKKVDSGGKWKNNIGEPVDNKIEWLKSYKFNICFENSSYPGYLTEKLFEAFAAGCIPIYWGDTSLRVGQDNILDSKESSYISGGGGGR